MFLKRRNMDTKLNIIPGLFRLFLWSFMVLFLVSFFATVTIAETIKPLHVIETDLVKLKVNAIDLDNDRLNYSYSPPLNQNGQWQTGYDDAGTYAINITASDGIHQTVRKIILIVENKNREPVLLRNRITANESQTVHLKDLVSDPDNDPLSFVFQAPFDKNGEWKPSYQDEGVVVTTFTATDGDKVLKARVEVTVPHVNHAPSISNSFSDLNQIEASEDQMFKFSVDAEDVDKDTLTYLWRWDAHTIAKEKSGKYYLDFESAGNHTLDFTLSDGQYNVSKQWQVRVKNKNRKPHLALVPITVHEGEKVKAMVPEKDEDGDILTYKFQAPLDEQGQWQTGYDDAGDHSVQVTAFDGQEKDTATLDITVINVDRAPMTSIPKKLELNEGEKGEWKFEVSDPDGDAVKVSVANLPFGSVFNEKNRTLTWTPGYDTISRNGGWLSTLLNKMRLEQFLLRSRTYPLKVTSCSKNLCDTKTVSIVLHNVNRAPVLQKMNDITVKETETVTLSPSAIDPDGDIVHYHFTAPAGGNGQWHTHYGDKGTQVIYVTATDGKASQTIPVKIKVLKNNRPPSLKLASDSLVVNEGQQFMFHVDATDLDNDTVQVRLENMPAGASFKDGVFIWTPGYNTVLAKTNGSWNALLSKHPFLNKKFNHDEAVVWLTLVASDGEAEKVIHPVKVTVKNVNRAPTITSITPASGSTLQVGQPIVFTAAAQDEDNDVLQYTWKLGLRENDVTGTPRIERTFVQAGKKSMKIEVSDGSDIAQQQWSGTVEDVPAQDIILPTDDAEPQLPFTVKVYVVQR